MKFDEGLQKLFGLFQYSYKNNGRAAALPAALTQSLTAGQRAQALDAELASLLEEMSAKAPSQTLLSENELKSGYLDRMRRELETHRVAAGLRYPEDWWPEQQRKILDGLYAGDKVGVDQLAASLRGRVLQEVEQISRSLPSYPHIKAYGDWWRKRASLDANGWKALVEARQQSDGGPAERLFLEHGESRATARRPWRSAARMGHRPLAGQQPVAGHGAAGHQ